MRIYCYILIILSFGCYKKNEDIEAIPIEQITFKTTLKNHTPGVDYVINKTIEVSKELIIEPGVEIIIEGGCELLIADGGSINAKGTSGSHIIFKRKNGSSRWKGITVFSKTENELDFVEINGAGSQGEDHAALEIKPSGNMLISHCKIDDNGDASALLIAEKSNCRLGESCKFSNNNYPIQMDLFASFPIGNGCDFTHNRNNVIKVINQDGSPLRTTSDLQLVNYGLPYFFTGWLIIDQKKLTVNNGVTLLFESNTGIATTNNQMDVGASFLVNGNGTNRVNFGSFRTAKEDRWAGVILGNGNSKIYYANFNLCNSQIKERGIINAQGYAYIDCKYCSFTAEKSFCNISIIGKSVAFNSDIFTRNTFTNGLLPCLVL